MRPERAFFWQNGVFTDLGDLGGSRSAAEDITADGRIVGSSETASGDWHAFLGEGGRMTDLGTLGGVTSNAYDINNAGQVVGWSETAAGERPAAIWERGSIQQLPELEPAPDDGGYSPPTVAYGINDSGQIVGTSRRHAVLWS